MLNLAKSLFQAGASEGYGEEDLSAVVNAMRPGSARRSANNSSNTSRAKSIMAPSCWFRFIRTRRKELFWSFHHFLSERNFCISLPSTMQREELQHEMDQKIKSNGTLSY